MQLLFSIQLIICLYFINLVQSQYLHQKTSLKKDIRPPQDNKCYKSLLRCETFNSLYHGVKYSKICFPPNDKFCETVELPANADESYSYYVGGCVKQCIEEDNCCSDDDCNPVMQESKGNLTCNLYYSQQPDLPKSIKCAGSTCYSGYKTQINTGKKIFFQDCFRLNKQADKCEVGKGLNEDKTIQTTITSCCNTNNCNHIDQQQKSEKLLKCYQYNENLSPTNPQRKLRNYKSVECGYGANPFPKQCYSKKIQDKTTGAFYEQGGCVEVDGSCKIGSVTDGNGLQVNTTTCCNNTNNCNKIPQTCIDLFSGHSHALYYIIAFAALGLNALICYLCYKQGKKQKEKEIATSEEEVILQTSMQKIHQDNFFTEN